MNDPTPSNLDWFAFEYVTRSLSQSECVAFEQELFHSQEHREAVARAVELAMAAEFACRAQGEVEAASPNPTRRSTVRVRRWIWSAVAASVMFLVGWQASVWFLDRDPNRVGQPGIAGAQTQSNGATATLGVAGRELAMAWDQMRKTFTAADESEFAALAAAGAEADLADEPGDPPTVTSDIEAPLWMLAAVAGMQGAIPGEASAEDAPTQSDPATPAEAREEG
jgi:hypothetical protein